MLSFGAYQLFAVPKPVATLDDKSSVEMTEERMADHQRYLRKNVDARLRLITRCANNLKQISDEDVAKAAQEHGTKASADMRDAICSDIIDGIVTSNKAICDAAELPCPPAK